MCVNDNFYYGVSDENNFMQVSFDRREFHCISMRWNVKREKSRRVW